MNPIAGMGGRVGLKGTNGVLKEAIARGAKPISPGRAVEFLRKLKEFRLEDSIELITCPGAMGEDEAKIATFPAMVLPMPRKQKTTAEDTKSAVRRLIALSADLLVFVGGDGTARDILDAMHDAGGNLPVLGVPSGVKMHSGVFAVSPLDAAEVVEAFLNGFCEITDLEVMDVDEEAFRQDRLVVRLYGFLKGPYVSRCIVGSKQVSPESPDESENQMAVARTVVEDMDPKGVYILGPGTTVRRVADLLGVEKTLLGVDIYRNKTVIKDVNEKRILQEVKDFSNAWIVVSPIGRQGMLFGRGNQQISPEIIRRIGKDRIIVIATKRKIRDIEGGVLRVDTGDLEVDNMLRGYMKVITDYREWRLMKVQ
ncbi:MAG: ATP-NAD kinase family protein [Candidatus Freyarchaeota archaeon]